jgi:hypothetical protein
MKKIAKQISFFLFAAEIILPAPTLLLAWMTGKTVTEVMYR